MDERIRMRLIANDEEAWRALVADHRGLVWTIVARRVGPNEIEDLVQEVFLRVFIKLSQQRVQCHFKNWVASLAENIVTDFLRKRRCPESSIEGMDLRDPAESVDHHLADMELRKDLDQRLQSLAPQQREVILMRARGIPYSEIARSLGIDKANARNCFSRAVRKLRKVKP